MRINVNAGNEPQDKARVQQQTIKVQLIRALKPTPGACVFAAFAVGFVIFLLVACDAGTSPNASPTPTPSSIEEMQQQWKKEDAEWKERQKEPLPPASAEDRAMIEAELAAEKSRSKLSMSV